MSPKVRQTISDLQELSASVSGYRSIATLAEKHIGTGAIKRLKRRLEAQSRKVQLLTNIADQIANGVVITGESGLVTWVNHGFEMITGYSRREVLGRKPGAFLQGAQTDPATVSYMHHNLAKNKAFTAELINYHQNGTPYWVRIQCQPLEANEGADRGFIAIQTDINTEKSQQEQLENNFRMHRSILATLHDAVITTDIEGQIRTVNPAVEKMFGYPEDWLIGQPITRLMPPDVGRQHPTYLQTYSDRPSGAGIIMGNARTLRGQRSDGSRFPIRVAVTEATVNSERMMIAAIHDITESETARAGLQRFRQTLDSTLDCVFMFDACTLEFFYLNKGAVDQLGYSREELLKMHPFDIKPEYSEISFRRLISPLANGELPRLSLQTVHRHKNGHDIPVDLSLQYVKPEGESARFVAIVRDISEQLRYQEEIEHLAYYDPLTNLPNRRLIRRKLESSMEISSETGCFGAVLLSDLDDFKTINDTLGHRCGDELLIEISNRFLSALGAERSISRLGGDEFLAVLNTPHNDRTLATLEVTEIARKLLAAATQPTETLGQGRPVSTSIGIVLYRDLSTSASELMRMADIAMYDAKRKGKNSFSIFDSAMQQKLLDEQSLIVDLNAALGRDQEIVPWFQPKIDRDGGITGFEALVRWNHPERGLLSPAAFMELAEKTQLILPLSDHVLIRACRQMSIWREQFSIEDWTISVNVSQSQLAMRDFPQKVEQALVETGLPAAALILEVTETVVAENIHHSIRQIELVRAMGVKFSLDDFGTGYSSLSYLRQLPIDELKIDKSFVDSLLKDDEGPAIVSAILSLAHSLKLGVIAEGIEEQEQWRTLKKLGCEGFQGFLFSRPQTAETISQELEQQGLNTLNFKNPSVC